MDNAPTYNKLAHRVQILEQRLRDQQHEAVRNKLLSSVVTQCNEGIIVTDPAGKIIIVNDAFAQMHGYATADLNGVHVSTFHIDEEKQSFLAAERILADDGIYEGNLRHRRQDKSTFPTRQHNSLLRDEDGTLIGAIRRLSDISAEETGAVKYEKNLAYFEAVKEAMMTGLVVIDRETHLIQDVNSAAAAMIGLSKEQIIGQECHTFICPRKKGDCPITEHNQTVDNAERALLRADGSSVPILKTVTELTLPDGKVLIETFVDITERKEAERKLTEQSEFLRTILDSLTFPLYVINIDDYTIKLANNATRFGILAPTATCHQLTHHRDTPCDNHDHPCPVNEIKKTGSPAQFDHIHLDAEGNKRIVEVHAYPVFDNDGQLSQVIEYSIDITERRLGEIALEQAKETSEIANMAKSQFLANMSHEIRTPMNGVIGLLELLSRTKLEERQQRYIDLAKTSAHRMMDIVGDVLDFSKIEAGHLSLDPAPFNLQDLLDETLRTLTVTAQEKGVELFYRVQPDVTAEVIGDAGRLRQILCNLIGNAIKFTSRGEVLVEVGNKKAATSNEVTLLFAVHDTGIGISPENQKSIFNAFSQGDGSATREYGGTGLGLAIATELIELMDGKIGVESSPGEGSTFHFTVTLQRQPITNTDTGQWVQLENIRQLSILLAMSAGKERDLIYDSLREWLPSVTAADNGPDLCTAVQEKEIDVILLDSDLHSLDIKALAQINTMAKTRPAALVLMQRSEQTALATDNDTLNINATINLPTCATDLLSAIHEATTNSKRISSINDSDQNALPPSETHKQILVAEDDFINRTLITTILEQEGWQVTAVENGRLAVDLQGENKYDLILMDLQMPEMDGFAATAAIRRREQDSGAHIPIIALTAHALKEDRERCLANGMDEYLSKPVDYDTLLAVLNKLHPNP
ncbi:PAS domain-containing protein [Thermodesulfobacteriota bacterium]